MTDTALTFTMSEEAGVQLIARPRLIARLHELIHRRVVLVVAPAGYGKSTLLEAFAADCAAKNVALAVCRYGASEADTDGAGLLRGIATALKSQYPAAGDRTLHLLEASRAGVSAAETEGLRASALAVLLEEVRSSVPDYTLVVVDDYHLLDGSADTRRTLEALLERLPQHVHLALLSRSVPSLDTSRFVIENEVGALGPRDLAFTEEELALLLRDRYGIDPSPSLVAEVRRWTEGWVTGLILAMPSLSYQPGASGALGEAGFSPTAQMSDRRAVALLTTLSGARRGNVPLQEYLVGTLLSRLSPEEREMLLAAALPEVCDVALLEEVLKQSDAWDVLRRLERAGLPLVRDEAHPGRYRLHALLQQFLRAHLERVDRARYEALSRRWAEVARAHGQPEAALAHARSARWWEQVAGLLENHGQEWVDRGRWQLVEGALGALPNRLVERRPLLIVCSARLAVVQGKATLAVERARQAFFVARAAGDDFAEARALLMEAFATLAGGRVGEALQLCFQAIEHEAVVGNLALRAEAYRYLGAVEGLRGLAAAAVEHLELALTAYEELGYVWDVAVILNNLSIACQEAGLIERARHCQARALALYREMGHSIGIAHSLNNLGMLRFYAGALDEAEDHFQETLVLAKQVGIPALSVAPLISLGDICRVRQRPREALRWYRAGAESAPLSTDSRLVGLARAGEASAYLDLADSAAAEIAARKALEVAADRDLPELAGQAHALLAGAALLQQRTKEAGIHLAAAREAARQTGSKSLQVRSYLWSGLAAYQRKRWGEATSAVHLAAEAAAALGGPAPLALEGLAMVPLLKRAASRGIAPALLERALYLLDRETAGALVEALAPEPEPLPLPSLELRLLGPFSLKIDGRAASGDVPPNSRFRELLVYLALHPEGRRREEIATELWAESETGAEASLVYTTAHRLRQALFPEILASEGSARNEGPLRLSPAVKMDVDVHRLEAHLSAAALPGASVQERRKQLTEAMALYRGPFASEFYSNWAEQMRRRLERRAMDALAQLADLEWRAGEYVACLQWCQRLLDADSRNEDVHHRILECYERLGQPLAGVTHYRRYLQECVHAGGTPSTRMTGIYRRLQQDSGGYIATV